MPKDNPNISAEVLSHPGRIRLVRAEILGLLTQTYSVAHYISTCEIIHKVMSPLLANMAYTHQHSASLGVYE